MYLIGTVEKRQPHVNKKIGFETAGKTCFLIDNYPVML